MTQAVVTSLAGLVPVVIAGGIVLTVTDQVFKKRAKAQGFVKKKAGKTRANYVSKSKVEGQRCGNCDFFVKSTNTCRVVTGKVSPGGWSKFWEED